jgi:hypothetical protein
MITVAHERISPRSFAVLRAVMALDIRADAVRLLSGRKSARLIDRGMP